MAKRKNDENAVEKDTETAAQRFRRLANQRIPKLVARLRQIGALGNQKQYESTQDERARIVDLIQSEVDRMEQALNGGKFGETFNLFADE